MSAIVVCRKCHFIYDPAVGDPDGGIAAGTTPFAQIPDSWRCPACGAKKNNFYDLSAPPTKSTPKVQHAPLSIKSSFSDCPPPPADYHEVLTIYDNANIYAYASGYIDAVEKLIGGIPGFSASDDPLIYPCLFMLRHCFELLLKNYLRKLIEHYKSCRIVKSAVHRTRYASLKKHMLIPIYRDILSLRSIESHHKNLTITDLREDLEFLDSIDPEATAFRYEKTKADTDQVLHHKQQWVDIRQILTTARSIYCYLNDQAESKDLCRCAAGLFSQSTIQNLRRYSSSLAEFIEWRVAKGAELGLIDEVLDRQTDGFIVWDPGRTMANLPKYDRLYELVREHFTLSRLKNVILGYYNGRDDYNHRKSDFHHINSYESAIEILRTKSLKACQAYLSDLNVRIAELEEMDRKSPFPK